MGVSAHGRSTGDPRETMGVSSSANESVQRVRACSSPCRECARKHHVARRASCMHACVHEQASAGLPAQESRLWVCMPRV